MFVKRFFCQVGSGGEVRQLFVLSTIIEKAYIFTISFHVSYNYQAENPDYCFPYFSNSFPWLKFKIDKVAADWKWTAVYFCSFLISEKHRRLLNILYFDQFSELVDQEKKPWEMEDFTWEAPPEQSRVSIFESQVRVRWRVRRALYVHILFPSERVANKQQRVANRTSAAGVQVESMGIEFAFPFRSHLDNQK